jgi:cytochrome c-type biogenesis protein CcmE
MTFVVTDGKAKVPVAFRGVAPDLFKEGSGVVAEGRFNPDGSFIADNLLAKHDERYMPREVSKALKEQGEWRGDGQAPSYQGYKPGKPTT